MKPDPTDRTTENVFNEKYAQSKSMLNIDQLRDSPGVKRKEQPAWIARSTEHPPKEAAQKDLRGYR
jgi:hypothetical protein